MLKFKCNFWFIFFQTSSDQFFSKQLICLNLIFYLDIWFFYQLSERNYMYQLSTITYLKQTYILSWWGYIFLSASTFPSYTLYHPLHYSNPPSHILLPLPSTPFFFSFFKNYTYKIWTDNLCIRIPAPYLLDHTGNSCKSPYISTVNTCV